ncbi:hypothetical protein BH23CHL4_BH23CHL4_07650 [soil metagenome]
MGVPIRGSDSQFDPVERECQSREAATLLPGGCFASDPECYRRNFDHLAYRIIACVDSRTAVLQDGIWIETTLELPNIETEKFEFLSDDYFALMESHPDLAEAFVLGDQVIAISNGVAFEVTSEG